MFGEGGEEWQNSSVDLEREKAKARDEHARELRLQKDELSRELSAVTTERDVARRTAAQATFMQKQAWAKVEAVEEENRALGRERAQLKFLLSRQQQPQSCDDQLRGEVEALCRERDQLKFLLSRQSRDEGAFSNLVYERDQLRGELFQRRGEVDALSRERDQLKEELFQSRGEVDALSRERDQLNRFKATTADFVKHFHDKCAENFPDFAEEHPRFCELAAQPTGVSEETVCMCGEVFTSVLAAVAAFAEMAQNALNTAAENVKQVEAQLHDETAKNERLGAEYQRLLEYSRDTEAPLRDAVAKNEKLVSEYQRLAAYSKETDQLLAAAANEVEELKSEMKLLRDEMDKAEMVIQSQVAANDKMRTRMAWKSKAEEQVFVEDGRKLSVIIENMRAERDKFQGRALRSSKSIGSLSALVKNLRMENNRFRTLLVEARARIPAPNSLIVIRPLEEKLAREIAANAQAAASDPDHPVCDANKNCAGCMTLWIAMKHYRQEVETLGLKVQLAQSEYKEHVKANDATLRSKLRESELDLESSKAQIEVSNRELRKQVGALEKTIKEKDQELETTKGAAARRNQHKDSERDTLNARISELEGELTRTTAFAGDNQVCGKLALQVLHSIASTGAELTESAHDVQYLSDMAWLIDSINMAATSEEPVAIGSTRRSFAELAELLCRRDVAGEVVLFQVVSRLLSQQQQQQQAPLPAAPIDVPYIPGVDDAYWQECVWVLKDLLPLCVRLAKGMCEGGRWRTQIDFDLISARTVQLETAVDAVFHSFGNGNGPDLVVLNQVRQALYDPLQCGDAFITWLAHQAIACIGINEQFALAMKETLNKERLMRQEQFACNQRLIANVQAQVKKLIAGIDSDANAPLYANDADMLLALIEGAGEASGRVAPFIESEAIPVQLKNCVNDMQLCLTFLGRITMAMYTNTYDSRGKKPEVVTQKRARIEPPKSPTYSATPF